MKKAIFYTDGSCKPNPGFGGFGYFGYTFLPSKKPTKHIANDLYFTSKGLDKEKENISVDYIYEYIEYIPEKTTNNHAELYSVISVLKRCLDLDIDEVTILADSNYIVSNIEILHKWKENNWRRVDNRELIHVNEWKIVYILLEQLKEKNVKVNINWIKGHSNNLGNDLADFYSAIGSNAALIHSQYTDKPNVVLLDHQISYSEYKESLLEKDIILNFKDMFYNPSIEKATYHFLANFENDNLNIGKKNMESILGINIGYIPEFVNKIKNFIHNVFNKDSFLCIKLSKLKNKNYLRLFKYVEVMYILEKNKSGYRIVTDDNDLIYPMNFKFPLILNVSKTFDFMLEGYLNQSNKNIKVIDITKYLFKDNKCLLKNSDVILKFKDENELNKIINFYLEIGKDIPSYLFLKSIENDIEKVDIILDICYEDYTVSCYTLFKLKNRDLITCHTLSKYLLKI